MGTLLSGKKNIGLKNGRMQSARTVEAVKRFEFGAVLGDLILAGLEPASIEQDGSLSIDFLADDNVNQYGQAQAGLVDPLPAGSFILEGGNNSVVAFEVEIEFPPLVSPSNTDGLQASMSLGSAAGGGLSVFISGVNTGGVYNIISPVPMVSGVSTETGGVLRFGVDAVVSAGTATITLDGNSESMNFAGGVDLFPFVTLVEASLGDPLDVGKKLGFKLIQDASEFTETHTVGAVSLANAMVVLGEQ